MFSKKSAFFGLFLIPFLVLITFTTGYIVNTISQNWEVRSSLIFQVTSMSAGQAAQLLILSTMLAVICGLFGQHASPAFDRILDKVI